MGTDTGRPGYSKMRITSFAIREKVALIAMYAHDWKGLARRILGSIASQVLR